LSTTPHRIDPKTVTKPIQLLAAWLVGLIAVDITFLTTAAQLNTEGWEREALVVAAIANVPVFLLALFVLQTKFRPELQEDSFYSQYLDKKTNKVVKVGRDETLEREISALRSEIQLLTNLKLRESQADVPDTTASRLNEFKIGLNKHLTDFANLRSLLREKEIRLSEVFGAEEPPDNRIMAVSQFLSRDDRVPAIKLACEMNLDGYVYFNPFEEEIEEDILIGAYGDLEYPITEELTAMMQNDPESGDLRAYEARSK